jgi:AraC-like DNA-binding protein
MIQEHGSDLLLAEMFSKVATPDLRVARPAIEKLHGPFQAHHAAPGSHGAVEIRAALCGQMAIGTFSFGRNVDIVPNALANAVIVTTAIRGRAAIDIGGATYGMDAGETVIAHEEDHPVFRYAPDTEVLKLRIHRARLVGTLARTGGVDALRRSRLRFDTRMSDPDTSGRWIALLRFVVATMNASVRRPPSLPELSSMEEMAMLTLLNSQPHNHASSSSQGSHDAAGHFARAIAYIGEYLPNEITLADISAAACCSPRTLARAFKLAGVAPPMQYVYKLRLQKIRSELLAPSPAVRNIADIAFAWGYRHLGEFNRQYRSAFGETPTQTRKGVLRQLA